MSAARRDRDRRLRDGQPPLGREGARARRRDGRGHPRPRRAAALRRAGRARASARSRSAMRDLRELGLDELIRERAATGHARCSASAWGCSCCSSAPRSSSRRDGLGLIRGEVTRARRRRAADPAHRLERGALRARLAADRGAAAEAAVPSTTCTRSRRSPPTPRTSRHRRVRRALRHDRRARLGVRRPVPPREVLDARAAHARELRRRCAPTGSPARRHGDGARMILLPAIDIRDGKAVRLAQGEFDAETVYDADPLDAARRWVDDGARGLHVVDLDGARSGAPANLEHVRRIAAEVGVPVQVGGGLRTIDGGPTPRSRPAPPGSCSAPPPTPTSTSSTRRSREFGDRVVVSVDARDGRLAASGWTEQTEMPVERRDRAPRRPRRARGSCTRASSATGCSTGPDLDGRPARRRGRARARSCTRAGSPRSRTSRAGGAAAGQPGRRDRRQGALRAALHGRRGAGALARTPRPKPTVAPDGD